MKRLNMLQIYRALRAGKIVKDIDLCHYYKLIDGVVMYSVYATDFSIPTTLEIFENTRHYQIYEQPILGEN